MLATSTDPHNKVQMMMMMIFTMMIVIYNHHSDTSTDIRIIRFRYKIIRLSGKEYGDDGDVDEDHSNDNNHNDDGDNNDNDDDVTVMVNSFRCVTALVPR